MLETRKTHRTPLAAWFGSAGAACSSARAVPSSWEKSSSVSELLVSEKQKSRLAPAALVGVGDLALSAILPRSTTAAGGASWGVWTSFGARFHSIAKTPVLSADLTFAC